MDDLPLSLKVHLVLAGISAGIVLLIFVGMFFEVVGENMAKIAGILSGYLVVVAILYGDYSKKEKKKIKKN